MSLLTESFPRELDLPTNSTWDEAAPRDQLSAEQLANLGTLAARLTPGIAPENPEQQANRENEVYRLTRDPETYEVNVESDITLEDIERVTSPEDWALIQEWAEPLKGKIFTFINPTMEGGGVAMIRPAVVHMLNLLGAKAHWIVMEPLKSRPEEESSISPEKPLEEKPKENPFIFTKLMHNISQRMTSERITLAGKALHWKWADTQNGPVIERQEIIRDADFIFIDDPQPAPLFARLKKANPEAKFIWRDHIDTDADLKADPSTPQGEVANYIFEECGIGKVDAVMTHPVKSFINKKLYDKTYFTPATYDPFDELNNELSDEQETEGMEFINAAIEEKNVWLIANGYTPIEPLSLDPNTERLTQIARFCPSKAMEKAMKMDVMTRQQMRAQGVPEDELPEIVIVGNGSQDDPDGPWVFEEMLRLREQYPEEDRKSIIIMRLKHNYTAMNALMRRSSIITQTSDREGLETRVSDAINHGKPVVISNRGGIKTQVVEGESGIILDFDRPDFDLKRGANFMSNLLMNPDEYAKMVRSTKKQSELLNKREFRTSANVARILRICNDLTGHPVTTVDKKTWLMSDFVAASKDDKRIAA